MKLLDTGTRLDDYQILKVLGYGGVGVVYLCEDKKLLRKVIIKEIFPSDLVYRGESSNKVYAKQGKSKDFIRLTDLIRERVRLIALLDHPSIPKIYRHFDSNNTFYICMEYIEGNSLDQYLKNNKELTEEEIKFLFTPILSSIKYMHEKGILHCDIKPTNILIDYKSSSPIIIDLESTRSFNSDINPISLLIVTDGYSAPEQYNSSKKVGPEADIYSLGCSLYKSMFPEIPLPSSMERLNAIINGEPDPLISAKEKGKNKYSQSFLNTVDSMIQLKVNNRPRNIASILWAFENTEEVKLSPPVNEISYNNVTDTEEYTTRIFNTEEKEKRIKAKSLRKNKVFLQVASIIGGVILSSSLLSILIEEPSFILETIVYSIGAILGFLLSRGGSK